MVTAMKLYFLHTFLKQRDLFMQSSHHENKIRSLKVANRLPFIVLKHITIAEDVPCFINFINTD